MSNPILQDIADIIWRAAPELRVYGVNGPGKSDSGYELWRKLEAGIQPVKFGNTVVWSEGLGSSLALARYQVPRDFFNVVLRVETKTINYTSGAIDLSLPSVTPPGFAYWQYESLGSTQAQILTNTGAPAHTMTNCEEFLVFSGGQYAVLILDITAAPPDDEPRNVDTLVYSYNVTTEIADRIGTNQAEMIIP